MGVKNWAVSQVDNYGRRVIEQGNYSLQLFQMVYLAIRAAAIDQAQGLRTIVSVVAAQIYFTGVQALPIISALALASGGIVVMQAQSQLHFLGGSEMVGSLLVIIIIREVGPLLTSLIVIARSGTAVASEIGNMRANREIDALEVMGIDPLSYIVFPRLLGGVISVVCLALYFIGVAVMGGFLVTRLTEEISFGFYTDALAAALASEDVFLFFVKNLFSGTIIFAISSFQGLSVKRSPHEVPQVTTRAVMKSIIYVIVFNMSVTTLFYLNQLRKLGVL